MTPQINILHSHIEISKEEHDATARSGEVGILHPSIVIFYQDYGIQKAINHNEIERDKFYQNYGEQAYQEPEFKDLIFIQGCLLNLWTKQRIEKWLNKNCRSYLKDPNFEDQEEAEDYLINDALASVNIFAEDFLIDDEFSSYKTHTIETLDKIRIRLQI